VTVRGAVYGPPASEPVKLVTVAGVVAVAKEVRIAFVEARLGKLTVFCAGAYEVGGGDWIMRSMPYAAICDISAFE
jgi:hypothetical protein